MVPAHPALTIQRELRLARTAMLDARTALVPPSTEFTVGIPEHNGPDSPSNPWLLKPTGPDAAAAQARTSLEHLDRAIGASSILGNTGLLKVLEGARAQAVRGADLIETFKVARIHVSMVLDGLETAKDYLDAAAQLVEREYGAAADPQPQVIPEPQVLNPEFVA